MPEANSPSDAVLDALGYALFLPDENGALRLAGRRPDWLAALCPGEVLAAEASPFLENFLIDARACWSAGGRVESGPWIEPGDLQLRATALTAGGRACLLIERLGEAFAASVSVLQKARETVIALQRLDAEIQKKEILVHCLAEDLSAALGNVVTSLRLVELEENSPRTHQLLGLAMRGAQEQRQLIQKMLDLFSDELGGLYGRADADADLHRVLRLAVENVAPHFSEKGVRLVMPDALAMAVSTEAARFERVVANLLHNALEHTPAGGEVAVHISEDGDAALLTVEHPGEAGDGHDPSRAHSPEALLRLQFCRIAVESCQGEIGFTPREGGGTRAWVRLPKSGGAR